jgi:hypothetical protein
MLIIQHPSRQLIIMAFTCHGVDLAKGILIRQLTDRMTAEIGLKHMRLILILHM